MKVGEDSVANVAILIIGLIAFVLGVTILERRDLRKGLDRRPADIIRICQRERKKSPSMEIKKDVLDKISFVSSVLTMIIVAIYTVLTFFQWRATKESYIDVQRAFISTPGIQVFSFRATQHSDIAMGFSQVISNDGATPTRDLKYVVNFAFSISRPLPYNYKFPDLSGVTVNRFPLGAHGRVNTAPRAITLETARALQSREQFLSIYGEVDYTDEFKISHVMMYCSQLLGFSDDMGSPVWEPCENNRHNCSDEECQGEPFSQALHSSFQHK